jgi:hypothetical protein
VTSAAAFDAIQLRVHFVRAVDAHVERGMAFEIADRQGSVEKPFACLK